MEAKIYRPTMTVTAVQWFKNGDHPDDKVGETLIDENGETYIRQEGAVVRYYRHPDVPDEEKCLSCGYTAHDHGWIDNGGDGIDVCPSNYVITGYDGRLFAKRADLFEEEYEEVD